MEDELHKLEQYCIITKIGNSQWGTQIVPVVKPNGNVRRLMFVIKIVPSIWQHFQDKVLRECFFDHTIV